MLKITKKHTLNLKDFKIFYYPYNFSFNSFF